MPLVPRLQIWIPTHYISFCVHTTHLPFHSSPVRYLWRPQGESYPLGCLHCLTVDHYSIQQCKVKSSGGKRSWISKARHACWRTAADGTSLRVKDQTIRFDSSSAPSLFFLCLATLSVVDWALPYLGDKNLMMRWPGRHNHETGNSSWAEGASAASVQLDRLIFLSPARAHIRTQVKQASQAASSGSVPATASRISRGKKRLALASTAREEDRRPNYGKILMYCPVQTHSACLDTSSSRPTTPLMAFDHLHHAMTPPSSCCIFPNSVPLGTRWLAPCTP